MKTTRERLLQACQQPVEQTLLELKSSQEGLSQDQVLINQSLYGANRFIKPNQPGLWSKLYDAIINPFTLILLVIALVSFLTNVLWAASREKDPTTVIIILFLVAVSGAIRFFQELQSDKATSHLSEMIVNKATVIRDKQKTDLPITDLVVGDVIHLSAGDMLPADVLLFETRDFFVQESSLTGESEPVEKVSHGQNKEQAESLLEAQCLAFMGSNVISGSAYALVLVTGNDTQFGSIQASLTAIDEATSFEKEMEHISWLLIRLMLILVPLVFLINGMTDGDWLEAGVFALSVGVGLTPEMLPMIITASLAKGSIVMAKEKVIIKKLNAIQDIGAIDVLCTDKTGTLTQDEVVLEYPLDIHAELDLSVIEQAYLNSYYQTGLKNLLDHAIIGRTHREAKEHLFLRDLDKRYTKIDELPFDFERRRMSVMVTDQTKEKRMVTKGALEEMLGISNWVKDGDAILPMTQAVRQNILDAVDDLNQQGLRVLGISYKSFSSETLDFTVSDESDMILMGYLAFLDPPKESAAPAIEALKKHGVATKILTGDNEKVSQTICEKVGLDITQVLLGSDIENLSDQELQVQVEKTSLFAKLSPQQKARVIYALKANGHKVGYMGDGINDAPSMKVADVGISVDSAVDIAKEVADVILLNKDLMVLEKGIIEGRKVYANMTKYIKMTVSSNFGNIFSLLVASVCLPFLPMSPIHLIVLNLIYDLSCVALPFDHVDQAFLKKPHSWTGKSITRFMLWMGPISSIFDILTYAIMFFLIAPLVLGGHYHMVSDKSLFVTVFQTGWFIESMWTQTLVIYLLRSAKLSLTQSKPAPLLLVSTLLGLAFVTLLPFSPLANLFKLSPLPLLYFISLFLVLLAYLLLVTYVKARYIKRYHEWL
ncbi:magnesium-translocating P-type ATPase [Streptococcus ictaluri]|uniref:Magnesium-transporting ATPase, P-type 1 n=1 Tax=Streptococcus ictaluri 707-05 TaxID=764299 RepID=G5JZE9_9STRE|nr:magnesium-translocating P-type ATPase [Streptococcus ictaluri]EHI70763.1 magnesium-importing ATPase [Streptococcus ictaluri 707-05]